MTLDEFKQIYFWEYIHRMFGRSIGVVFTLPGVYFFARGAIPAALYPRLMVLFALGGGQGLIGWWMVKSGLDKSLIVQEGNKEIRVSPYRLATHLTMAFTTYTLLVYTALELHAPLNRFNSSFASLLSSHSSAGEISGKVLEIMQKQRKFAIVTGCVTAVTVVSGAYVAGNDAGRAYNTYPKMTHDDWIAPEVLDWSQYTPKWRNVFENIGVVQFNHRVLAHTAAAMVRNMSRDYKHCPM